VNPGIADFAKKRAGRKGKQALVRGCHIDPLKRAQIA
jgi:hypothetical protein